MARHQDPLLEHAEELLRKEALLDPEHPREREPPPADPERARHLAPRVHQDLAQLAPVAHFLERELLDRRARENEPVERGLLRALAITDPEFERGRRLAAEALAQQPTWFEHLGTFAAMRALATRQAADPMDVVEDEAQRALLAEALLAEVKPPEETEIQSAVQEIQERAIATRLRDLRTLIAEAERRGDFAELAILTQQKLELDKALRKLHNSKLD